MVFQPIESFDLLILERHYLLGGLSLNNVPILGGFLVDLAVFMQGHKSRGQLGKGFIGKLAFSFEHLQTSLIELELGELDIH